MSSAPLLSIVVPTRNRPDYAVPAIRSLLAMDGSDYEVVVEDNSDHPDLEPRLGGHARDPRLRYRLSQRAVSMTENYERACLRATGDFVCVIGDDDSVSPQILDASRWAEEQGVDALVPTTPAHYVWPDLHLAGPQVQRASQLRIAPFSGATSSLDPLDGLQKCLRRAGQTFYGLPKLYYGVVRRTCIDRAREAAGAVFPGVSPDLAAAIALAPHVGEVRSVDFPLFLPGSSARSNAGLSGLGRHIGRLSDQPHLPRDCEATWSQVVPPFYSVTTLWAETAVSAITRLGRHDLLPQFNVPYLYAWLWTFYRGFRPSINATWESALHATGRTRQSGRSQFVYHVCAIAALRARYLLRRLHRPRTSEQAIGGLRDIQEAALVMASTLSRQPGPRPW